MAVLTKREIIEYIRGGELVFNPPLDELQLRPHAIDLRLGFKFHVPQNTVDRSSGRSARILDYYTMKNGQLVNFEEIILKPGQHFDILPGEMIMGFSYEGINLNSPMLMAIVYPRSSVNRRGLSIDLTGIVDAGYKGHLMFPIRNNTNFQVIRMYPGERICQLVFEKFNEPVIEGYQGRYKTQKNSKDHHGGYLPETNQKEIQYIREGKLLEIKRDFPYVIH